MRIIAGKYRSRLLHTVPDQTTRPTADKIKGAVFSSLQGKIEQGRMLDCYSGTGNMALEALSRGMSFATMVEKDPKAIAVIRSNVKELKESNCEILAGSIESQIVNLRGSYRLVYLDPPYAYQKNVEIIERLLQADRIESEGYVVIESQKQDSFPENIGPLKKLKEKCYGITKITYYRKEDENDESSVLR